ncbi:MAG: chromosomal replication initiator protein DnaA [Myxococcales bacterium]|nr:chromosomal replication initiator protein DnaA [Myxococcales bacterium]
MSTSLSSNPSALWARALDSLKERIKPHNFDMWLRPIACHAIEGTDITLRAPNRYIKEWFEDNYLSVVLQELHEQTGYDFQVDFQLDEPDPTATRVLPDDDPARHDPAALPPASLHLDAQMREAHVREALVHDGVRPGHIRHDGGVRHDGARRPQASVVSDGDGPADWGYELNDRYDFDNFVVGPSNQLAHAASQAVAELPAAKYNPLFIYGGVGLGKTHLISAIGHFIKKGNPQARIAYLSSERFMNEYINHLRSNRMEHFRRKFRDQCDVLLMDDIQFIAGKDRTQDEFFHTFNALYDLHRQIVVTSDKYPHEIPDLEERLRTRFQWGLIADIQQPELETRVAILKKKAESEQINLPDNVALYLAQHIKSNVRELEGSLIRLAAFASLQKSGITIELAQDTLKSFLSQRSSSLTVEAIQKEVAGYFNIKVSDLKSAKRHKAVARPRQIAMFLSRKLTGCSYPEIGTRFGGKDHSTVISACRKIEDLVAKDLSIRTTVETLERQLQL